MCSRFLERPSLGLTSSKQETRPLGTENRSTRCAKSSPTTSLCWSIKCSMDIERAFFSNVPFTCKIGKCKERRTNKHMESEIEKEGRKKGRKSSGVQEGGGVCVPGQARVMAPNSGMLRSGCRKRGKLARQQRERAPRGRAAAQTPPAHLTGARCPASGKQQAGVGLPAWPGRVTAASPPLSEASVLVQPFFLFLSLKQLL